MNKKINSLLSCAELNKLMTSKVKGLKILDCTWPFKKGYPVYKQKRIPTAQYLNLEELRNKESSEKAGFPQPNTMKEIMKTLNIGKESQIICYDQYGIFTSTRAWFVFKAYRFPNVFVLDGGLPKWAELNYSIETSGIDDSKMTEGNYVDEDLDYDRDLLANYEDVMKIAEGKENAEIIDTRPDFAYKMDHIPGSKNIPFNAFTNKDQTMKNKEDLVSLFKSAGVDPNKNVISSCGIGISACLGMFALKEVVGNENTKLYNGSYEEYDKKTK